MSYSSESYEPAPLCGPSSPEVRTGGRACLLSVIVPCRETGPCLAELVDRILAADTLGLATEVILVDDGSRDETPDTVRALVDRHEAVHGVLRRLPGGHEAAVSDGLRMAEGDLVLVQRMDAAKGPLHYPEVLAPALAETVNGRGSTLVIEL